MPEADEQISQIVAGGDDCHFQCWLQERYRPATWLHSHRISSDCRSRSTGVRLQRDA
jgi:hypothetical protein